MKFLRALLALIFAVCSLVLVVPILLLSLPVWGISLPTRLFHGFLRRLKPKFVPWQQLIEFDPKIGWKPKANLDTYGFAGDVFHIRTDSEGMSGKCSFAESEMVVIGDSFAWGYGVDDERVFSELNSSLRIKRVGSPGYDMVQGLLLMRRLSIQLRGKLVVWFIYCGNDLYDNLFPHYEGYRKPFVRQVGGTGEWEIVTNHVGLPKWTLKTTSRAHIPISEVAALHSPTFLSKRAYSACKFLIKEASQLCRLISAQLAVLNIPPKITLGKAGLERLSLQSSNPHSIDPKYPDYEIGKICRKYGIQFLSARDFLTEHHYKLNDEHWNEKGHRQVATLLRLVYQQYMSQKDRSVVEHKVN